jgi:uncharacterized membrane protein YphA (DoxX/SURF4 family)
MKINEPFGNPNIGPFFLRMALGGYFVVAGLMKLDNLPGFIEEVRKFGVLGPNVSRLYATLLPYLEIVSGTLLIMGFWTTLAALLCSIMLISFIFAIKIFPNGNYLFNKDLILLAASVCLMFTGSGSLSIDKFRRDS